MLRLVNTLYINADVKTKILTYVITTKYKEHPITKNDGLKVSHVARGCDVSEPYD